jgi:uncharacterized protein YPO0396
MSENNIIHEDYNFFTDEFETENKEIINDFYNKLASLAEKGDENSSCIKEYLDYRNYIDYEFWEINEFGEKRALSKIYKDCSGGESQTPHYILSAAAISLLYNPNSIKLIVLDEAFNQMDEERINAVMVFFKALGLQIILSAPLTGGKMSIIAKHMDTNVIIYKENKITHAAEVPYNDKNSENNS